MTYTGKGVPDHARDIEDRLTKRFVHLRLAKVKQILEQTGHAVEDIMFIQQREYGWRIGPVHPFPLHPRDVAPLTFEIRSLHYRMKDPGRESDDESEHRLAREVAEYLATDGYGGRWLQQRVICLGKRRLDVR